MKRSKEQGITTTAAALMLAGAVALGAATAQGQTEGKSMMDPMMDSMTGMMMPMLVERAGMMVQKMQRMREDEAGYMLMMGEMSDRIDRMARMSDAMSKTMRAQMSMGNPMSDEMFDACMMMDMGTVKGMGPDDSMMMQCQMMGHMMRMRSHIGSMASMMMDSDMQRMEKMMDGGMNGGG